MSSLKVNLPAEVDLPDGANANLPAGGDKANLPAGEPVVVSPPLLPTCAICFQETLVVVPMCQSVVPHLICMNCLNSACFSTHLVGQPSSHAWEHCSIADETRNFLKCPVCKSQSTLSAAPVLPPIEIYSTIFPGCELGGPRVLLDGVRMSLHSAISHIFRMQCQQRDLPVLVRQRAYSADSTLPGERRVAAIAEGRNAIDYPALRLPALSLADYRPSIECKCGAVISVPVDSTVRFSDDPPQTIADSARGKLNLNFTKHLHDECQELHCHECGAGPGSHTQIQVHSALHRLQQRLRTLLTPASSIMANARLLADSLEAIAAVYDQAHPTDLLVQLVQHTVPHLSNSTARRLMQLLTARL